ncbi:hypothetical protein DP43_3486 [Burkholderia pseudomallei]|nr:hypothetical protein DP43_3486 [Burkholderia pseudomallei]
MTSLDKGPAASLAFAREQGGSVFELNDLRSVSMTSMPWLLPSMKFQHSRNRMNAASANWRLCFTF